MNQYIEETGPNGEDIWRSTSNFMPSQSESYGTIKIGQIMSMEFDFIWHGRTNNPNTGYYEQFFRVGYSAKISKTCTGEGSRYPSFWLTNDQDTMHVSVSSGTQCQPTHSLNQYGNISIGVLYHIKISFDNTKLRVDVSGGNNPSWTQSWSRYPTNTNFLGHNVSVWFMSDKYAGEYNIGNGTFSNVTIISEIFTVNPTSYPTTQPTTTAPTITTINPTNNPLNTPTVNPSITPTNNPSITPSNTPTITPTYDPSITPTNIPTITPSNTSTISPTYNPTSTPTHNPIFTQIPTINPTISPTENPSQIPTHIPTITPSENPSITPTDIPTHTPSITPTNNPITTSPSARVTPTYMPSITPTIKPSPNPM